MNKFAVEEQVATILAESRAHGADGVNLHSSPEDIPPEREAIVCKAPPKLFSLGGNISIPDHVSIEGTRRCRIFAGGRRGSVKQGEGSRRGRRKSHYYCGLIVIYFRD
jgi:hypothetical protein